MNAQSLHYLEADTKLLGQCQGEEQHILVGFHRQAPSQQLSVLRLVDTINETTGPRGL